MSLKRKAWLANGLMGLFSLAALVTQPVQAQSSPLADATVNDFISALSEEAGATTRAFRPTAKPDANNRCAGQAVGGVGSGGGTKNLEVEYADDSAPQVNLALRFDFSSDALAASDKRLLDKLASALNHENLRSARFAVAGHTDLSGDQDINLRLSCARALAAKRYLLQSGVASERLTAYGFGPLRLLQGLAPNAAQHRRVEIRRAN
jgi:outer membrane protein OmpA-like peptidoglycan-associated protein